MRKLHWLNGERTMCRPISLDKLKRDVAEKVTGVTCKPCLKALGLSSIVFKASAKKARVTISLPNGKKPVCLAEEFEMTIDNAPVLEEMDLKSFLAYEPEPISFKVKLTEAGWDSLRQAMIGK